MSLVSHVSVPKMKSSGEVLKDFKRNVFSSYTYKNLSLEKSESTWFYYLGGGDLLSLPSLQKVD